MFSLANLPKYCLATITLGCLSFTGLPASQNLQRTQVPPPDPGHRGSGRVVAQVPAIQDQGSLYDYRGTGRLHQGKNEPVAQRGSGRGRQDGTYPVQVSYRGSGRVMPNPWQATKWV